MKKFIISLALIFSFGAYALFLHRGPGEETALVAPASIASDNVSGLNAYTPPLTATQQTIVPKGRYADGIYTGTSEDAYYGYIQVEATISGGKISSIRFLQYPNDRRESRQINSQADPWLAQEAIQAQSSKVDIITGATDTSFAFIRSLGAALNKAQS